MFLQQQLTMTAMIIPARKDNLLSISTKYGIKRRSQKNFNLTLNHAKTFNPGYNHTIWIPSERYEQSVQCCQRQSNKALKQIRLQAVISSETFRG